MKNAIIFIVAIVIAGSAGFALQRSIANTKQTDNPVIGQIRPEFAALDLQGEMRNIKEWDNKIILLNFWATWCPPCMREIPDFIELQNEYSSENFQIIGVALDETQIVREFADKIGINYPIMAVQAEAIELARRYGNVKNGLPYSVFINNKGEISVTITGELSKNRAISILDQLGANPI